MKEKLNCFIFIVFCFSSFSAAARSDGIANLSLATEGIYRGARPLNENEFDSIGKLGVKSIIDLQGGDSSALLKLYEPGENPEMIAKEEKIVTDRKMRFINIPLSSLDRISDESNRKIDEVLAFMNDKKNQPIYIHCEHGKDRTGLLIALYKVKYEGISPAAAYEDWMKQGRAGGNKILGHLDEYFSIKTNAILAGLKFLNKPEIKNPKACELRN
jgi:protein tyrosine/serine phosphatase